MMLLPQPQATKAPAPGRGLEGRGGGSTCLLENAVCTVLYWTGMRRTTGHGNPPTSYMSPLAIITILACPRAMPVPIHQPASQRRVTNSEQYMSSDAIGMRVKCMQR